MCKVAEPPGHLNQGMKNYPLRFPHLTSMTIIRGRRIVIYTCIREKKRHFSNETPKITWQSLSILAKKKKNKTKQSTSHVTKLAGKIEPSHKCGRLKNIFAQRFFFYSSKSGFFFLSSL